MRGRSFVTHTISSVKVEAMDQNSCRSLPFTLAFWLLFMGTQIGHRQVRLQNSLQQALVGTLKSVVPSTTSSSANATSGRRLLAAGGRSRSDLTGTGIASQSLDAVKTTDGVFLWLHNTLVPQIWQDGPEGRGAVLEFNRAIGGVRIQQFRLGKKTCPGSSAIQRAYNLSCYTGDAEGPRASEMATLPGLRESKGSLHSLWFDLDSSMATVQAQVQTMADIEWLSPATKSIWVQCTLLNAQVSLIAYAEVEFFLDRIGRIIMYTKVYTLPTEVYGDDWLIWFGDMAMVVLLLCLLVAEIIGLVSACSARTCRRYCKPVRVVNWVVIAFGTAFSIFFGYLSYQLEALAEDLAGVPSGPGEHVALGAPSWTQRQAAMDRIYDEVARLSGLLRSCELATFWYSLLLLLKFFHAFQGNPRLAIITQTLRNCAVDVLHFLVVFTVVFLTFSTSAYFLFGHQLRDWANLMVACNTAYRTLMGDFDFSAMYAIAPVSSIAWFWLFMTLTFLVMLNMLLAIVLETYAEVKAQTTDQATLWEQMMDFKNDALRGLRGRRTRSQPPGGADRRELIDMFAMRQLKQQQQLKRAAEAGGAATEPPPPELADQTDPAGTWSERPQQQRDLVDFPGTVPGSPPVGAARPIRTPGTPPTGPMRPHPGETKTSNTPRWFKQ